MTRNTTTGAPLGASPPALAAIAFDPKKAAKKTMAATKNGEYDGDAAGVIIGQPLLE